AAAAAFGIPRAPPAFGVRRGAPEEYSAAIHLGNTNSCIAAYDFRPGSHEYYQLCIPS
ncbi:hypothetical protein ACJX0J_041339, partial [Zea mays]